MPTTETDFQRFKAEHGEHVEVKGWYLFEDGARLGITEPVNYPAPTDAKELYEVREWYLRVRLQNARRDYTELHNRLVQQARASAQHGMELPFDWQTENATLAELQAKIDDCFTQYQEHTREAREETEAFEDARRELLAVNRDAANDVLKQLENL